MDDEFKRGYAKGYNTGAAAGRKKADEAAAVRRAAEASVAAMQARNGVVGQCRDCAHWRRGVDEDGRHWDGMKWGVCDASQVGAWPWFHLSADKKPLPTCEAFGCLRFSPRIEPPGGE
jgi:hypothetical protein